MGANPSHFSWFDGNAGARTHPVAGKLPNAWGLFDRRGNLAEWLADRDPFTRDFSIGFRRATDP